MKFMAILPAVLFATSLAFAADADNGTTQTVDTTKNPITGSVTKTKKTKKRKKNANGSAKVDATEKTKTMKDGSTKSSTEVEAKSEQNK